ncbi:DeoR/GlpR family DNA-binding transcription regulator [Roseovarius sp. MMSF_3281]|uniref:DeoR/GlpR family DNA-binding transcription regulator n=1 Tax=Roseovarius sp. MMSF_3281 TaxID=3046694 RepID=UPI00273EABBE|nr:DeoR/GlpR family DNA-binding transcription regulator [Roseovarius sp. MMSF_3281]
MTDTTKKGQRQSRLLAELAQQNYLSLEAISRRFGVTTQTARRDLIELEELGRLRRMHGGAITINAIPPDELRHRRSHNVGRKERIAAAAVKEIHNGAAIFLDTGTTCEAIARALLSHRDLRVVTYSLRIAAYLREMTEFVVAIPGGFVRQVDGGVFGDNSNAFLEQFQFDMAVISVSGLDWRGTLSDDDPAEVNIVREAMRNASSKLLAIDGNKFGQRGLVRLGPLTDMDVIVTDHVLPEQLRQQIEGAGLRYIHVKV